MRELGKDLKMVKTIVVVMMEAVVVMVVTNK